MNKKSTVFPLLFFCISACSPKVDKFLNYEPELSASAIDKCLEENPKVSRSACNLKLCLVNPVTYKAMRHMLVDALDIGDKLGIDIWADAGTALGAFRFNGPLPWDDDVDLGVPAEQFEPKTDEVRKLAHAKGYELVPYYGLPFSSRAQLWQMRFLENAYRAFVMNADATLSVGDADELWERYVINDSIPHLDFFLMDTVDDEIKLVSDYFRKTQLKGENFKRSDIYPLKKVKFLGVDLNVPNNLFNYVVLYYHTKNIQKDFVIQSNHNVACSTSVRLRDSTQHPEILKYLHEYMKHVFGSSFSGFSAELQTVVDS